MTVTEGLSEENRALLRSQVDLDLSDNAIAYKFGLNALNRLLDDARAEARRPPVEALAVFANVAREDGDAADFDDERVVRLVYDDPEWGDNTVLAEFFMRPFRKARALLSALAATEAA